MTLVYSGVPGLAVPGAFIPGYPYIPSTPLPVATGGAVTITAAGPGAAQAVIAAQGPLAAAVTTAGAGPCAAIVSISQPS